MESNNKELLQYLSILLRRKWLIILPTIIFAVIGVLVAKGLPYYYRSTTLILVEKQQVPESYVTPTDRTPFSERLGTIRQQIINRQNLEKIINEFNLYNVKNNNDSKDSTFGFFSKISSNMTAASSKEETLERMADDIDIEILGKRGGDAFNISYTSTEPYTAMQVTNRLASLFIEENLKVREQYAEGTSEFLAKELENARKNLEAQEKAVTDFKKKYMGSLPQQLDANLRTLDRLQTQLQIVRNEIKAAEDKKMLIEAQLGQKKVLASTNESAPYTVIYPMANPLAEELRSLQQQLSSLLSVYKEDYPDVIILKNRINELKEQLANAKSEPESAGEESSTRLSSIELNPEAYNELLRLKSQIKADKQKQDKIQEQIKEYEKRVEEIPSNEQRFADLRRDYDISLRNYQTLLEKKLNAQLAENLEKRQKGERFRVIDPANLPVNPYKPNKPMLALLITGSGSGLGFALALALEFLNPTFRDPEEITKAYNLPVLASIPDFSSGSFGKTID